MIKFSVPFEQVAKDFPNLLEYYVSYSTKRGYNYNEDEAMVFYYIIESDLFDYDYEEISTDTLHLFKFPYEERRIMEYEFLNVKLGLKLGDFYMEDSIFIDETIIQDLEYIPDSIKDIFDEVLKVYMLKEQKNPKLKDIDILCSIPPLNDDISNNIKKITKGIDMNLDNHRTESSFIRLVEDSMGKTQIRKELTIDDILDKICKKGMSSLTKKEKEYLKNNSKNYE